MNLALLVVLVLSQGEGEARLSGADVMPREILGCVRLRSASATAERLKNTALGDIYAEEEVQLALAELFAMIRDAPRPVEVVTGMKWEEILKAFGGELTAAVVGFEGNAPRACLALDVSEGREELDRLLAVARIALALAGGRQYIHRGYTIDAVPQQRMEICFTFVKNLLVLATTPADLEAMIARALGEGEALSSQAEFTLVQEKLGDPDLLLFVPVRELLARFAPMIPPRMKQGINLLRLDELRAFAMSTEVSGKEFVEKTYILASEGAGMLQLVGREGTGLPAVRYAPFDAFVYGAANISPGGFLDVLKEFAARAGGGPRLEREMGKLGELLGRPVEEFLDLFSGELQLHAVRPPGAGLFPDVVLTAELERPDEVARSLEALVTALEGRRPKLARSSYRGVRFYAVQGGRDMPVSPCFGVADGFAALTFGSQAMKRLIASCDMPGPALSENPRFVEAVGEPPRGAAGLSYIDLPEIVNFVYSTLVPFADNGVPVGDVQVQGLDLPLPEVLTSHLSPIVLVVRPEGETVFAELRSPVPVSVPLAIAAIGIAAEQRKERRRRPGPPPQMEEFEEGEDVF